MYVIVWEFAVAPERAPAFEAAYGPAGAWVALFRRAPAYLGTELLADGRGRYLTIDRWRDRAAYEAFRRSAAADYHSLDAACGSLTAAEREIGAFESVDAPGNAP